MYENKCLHKKYTIGSFFSFAYITCTQINQVKLLNHVHIYYRNFMVFRLMILKRVKQATLMHNQWGTRGNQIFKLFCTCLFDLLLSAGWRGGEDRRAGKGTKATIPSEWLTE